MPGTFTFSFGFGIGAYIEASREYIAMLFGHIGISIGTAVLILYLLLGRLEKMWPPKSNWEFSTDSNSFYQKVFTNTNRVNWTSGSPQHQGMFYKLDLMKEREITGVHFDHGNTNNVPSEWTMEFRDAMGGTIMPNTNTQILAIRGKDSIRVDDKILTKPIKVKNILVTIREPRIEGNNIYPWEILDIHLKENRFFGHWKKVI